MWQPLMQDLSTMLEQVIATHELGHAEIAASILEVVQEAQISHPIIKAQPDARTLTHALAWWLFVRAPSLRASYIVLSPMNIDLVTQSARALEDVLEDLAALERAAEKDELGEQVQMHAAAKAAFDKHGAMREDLLSLDEETIKSMILDAMASFSSDPEAIQEMTGQIMQELLSDFDAVGSSGALKEAFQSAGAPAKEDDRPALDSAEAYAERAESHYQDGDIELSLRDFASALTLDPDHVRALVGMAIIHATIEELDQAIPLLDRALELAPGDLAALHNRGLMRYAQRDFEAAIKDFGAVLESSSEDLEARLNRASAYAQRGEFDSALEDIEIAIKIAPSSARPLVDRAMIARAMGKDHDARKDLQSAIEVDKEDVDARANLAFLLLKEGAWEEAEAHLTVAIQAAPWITALHYNRGNARAARGDMAGAIEDYTARLEVEEQDVEALINRGTARFKSEDLQGALEDWDLAIQIDPYQPDTYLKRGAVLLLGGEPKYAIEDFEHAIEIAPAGWEFLDTARAQLAEAIERLDEQEEEDA